MNRPGSHFLVVNKASDFNIAIDIDKNIIRTEFSVDDSFGVDVLQPFDYSLQNMSRGIPSKQSNLSFVRIFSPPSHYRVQLRIHLLEPSIV